MSNCEANSASRQTQQNEIDAEKRDRESKQVARWETESRALFNPTVKVKSMLGEAANQELGRLRSYHQGYLSSLEQYKEKEARRSDGTSASSARLTQKIQTLTDDADTKKRYYENEVSQSYKSLINEYVATSNRMSESSKLEGKSVEERDAEQKSLASNAMSLHSSVFPWCEGILFQCPSDQVKDELVAKGWATQGESGRLQFNTFAASNVVSNIKQTSQEKHRNKIDGANERLHQFFVEEKGNTPASD